MSTYSYAHSPCGVSYHRTLSTISTDLTSSRKNTNATNTNFSKKTSSRTRHSKHNHKSKHATSQSQTVNQHGRILRNQRQSKPITRKTRNVPNTITTSTPNITATNLKPQSSTKTRTTTSNNATLDKCLKIMSSLTERYESLPSSTQVPFTWLTSTTPHTTHNANSANTATTIDSDMIQSTFSPKEWNVIQQRRTLYLDTTTLLKALELSRSSSSSQQQRMRIPNSHANYRTMKHILDQALDICAHSPPSYWFTNEQDITTTTTISTTPTTTPPTLHQTMNQIQTLLQSIYSDMEPHHYQSMIQSYLLEGNVKLASTLFRRQINVDEGGYVPMEGRLGWDTNLELGLWAVAQQALVELEHQTENYGEGKDVGVGVGGSRFDELHVVNQVMDAVLNMCLMLPTDQERCACFVSHMFFLYNSVF